MAVQKITNKQISISGSSNGQVLTANTTAVYWSTITGGGGGGASVTISTSAPGTANTGDLWWNSEEGSLKIYYADANTSQWVDASSGTRGANGANFGARVVSYADSTSITINADTTDTAVHINTQAAGTLTINAPTGTIVDGQRILIRIKSTNVQTFSWNAIFQGSADLSLPSVTSGSNKFDYIGFIYNSSASKWQLLSTVFGF